MADRSSSLSGNSFIMCRASYISSFLCEAICSSRVNSAVAAFGSNESNDCFVSWGPSLAAEKNHRKKTPTMMAHMISPKIKAHGALLGAGCVVVCKRPNFFLFRPLIVLRFLSQTTPGLRFFSQFGRNICNFSYFSWRIHGKFGTNNMVKSGSSCGLWLTGV